MIWSAPRAWSGETCAILAGGYSLAGFDAGPLLRRGVYVITINDSWRIAPWADAHYFTDESWWDDQERLNRRSLDGARTFAEESRRGLWIKGTLPQQPRFHSHPTVRTLEIRTENCRGLERDPRRLAHGENSGFAAINLARHFGARKILLLGYDMHARGPRSHWHTESRPANMPQLLELSMRPHFAGFVMGIRDGRLQVVRDSLVVALEKEGVEVVNCTPGSALTCWPHTPLEIALRRDNEWQTTRTPQQTSESAETSRR